FGFSTTPPGPTSAAGWRRRIAGGCSTRPSCAVTASGSRTAALASSSSCCTPVAWWGRVSSTAAAGIRVACTAITPTTLTPTPACSATARRTPPGATFRICSPVFVIRSPRRRHERPPTVGSGGRRPTPARAALERLQRPRWRGRTYADAAARPGPEALPALSGVYAGLVAAALRSAGGCAGGAVRAAQTLAGGYGMAPVPVAAGRAHRPGARPSVFRQPRRCALGEAGPRAAAAGDAARERELAPGLEASRLAGPRRRRSRGRLHRRLRRQRRLFGAPEGPARPQDPHHPQWRGCCQV